MPQVPGTIESVVGHPGANGKTRYEVTISGQGYNTWNPEIARVANEHLQQQVVANVTVKPSRDGQFMNYYFDGLADGAAGQVPGQQGIPMAGAPQATTPQIPVQPGIPVASPSSPPIPLAPPPKPDWAREARIVKQSSMATAFNFIGHLFDGAGPEAVEEAEAAAMELAKRLYVQVLGGPQTLDDEIVEGLVAEPQPPSGDEPETW